MARLRIDLLGSPRVELDGRPVEVDTRKATALLAYLVTTGTEHHRDAIAGLLWPEHDQEHSRGALRRTLSVLRKGLDGGWLDISRSTVRLVPADAEIDLYAARALLDSCATHGHPADKPCPRCVTPLREAAALHRGDFLAGFALRDSEDFEDWQQLEAGQLRRDRANVLDLLVRALIEAGDFAAAVEPARQRLALDTLHEPAHRTLMRLYAWTGERGAAIRQYRECVAAFDRELGVEPLAQTTALYEAIAADRVRAPTVAEPAPVSHTVPTLPFALPLVGRATQMTTLTAAYAVAAGGRFVVVEGEAGIGKTRLVEELAHGATARGGVVLHARCYADEAALAYAPFAEALRSRLDQPDRTWLDAVPAARRREAARLLGDVGPEPVQAATGPGSQTRFFEGVRAVLLAATAGPAPGLLWLDDVHAADDATLDLLTYLVRRLSGQPLCVVACWRTEDVPTAHRLRLLLGAADRDGVATQVRLDRLTRADIGELVRAETGQEGELADRLYADSEGLPYFVVEYLAAARTGELDTALPKGVRDLLQARVAALGDTATQVLSAAAVIGRSFDFETVREASGRSEDEAVGAVEELVSRGLVSEAHDGGPAYDFAHEKLRTFVVEATSLARRRLLHRRVAKALLRRARRSPDRVAAPLAYHLRQAGDDVEGARWSRRAGDAARTMYAHAEALAHYRTALALGEEDAGTLHELCGDVQTLLGDYAAALASYETATALGGPTPELAHKLGVVHHRASHWELAETHLRTALDGFVAKGEQARVEADRSLNAHRSGRRTDAERLAGRALDLATAAGDEPALAQAHNIVGVLASSRHDPGTAREHLEQAVAIARRLADRSVEVAAVNNLALAARAQGRLDEAETLTREALALCSQIGDRHREAALHNNLADLLHAMSRGDEAMVHLKLAVAIFAEVGEPGVMEPEIWKLVEW